MAAKLKRATYRVALTGGIASGKSTVAALFAALGVPLVDLDVIAREVVAPGSPLLAGIAARFGAEVIDAHGVMQRAVLRARIFADAQARADLEALLHPVIRAAAQAQATAAVGPYVVLVVPLLVESREPMSAHRVLVVDCDPALQLRRLQARDGSPLAEAEAILAAQASRSQRLAAAQDVIHNEGNIRALAPQVEKLHFQYLEQATQFADIYAPASLPAE